MEEKKINLDEINNAILPGTFLERVEKNVITNVTISQYYEKYAWEEAHTTKQLAFFCDRAERVKNCNKFWTVDRYELNKIKNLKKTYLCRDKFCANCKKVKQAIRSAKYIEKLYEYDSSLYFLTLTIPNVGDENLAFSVKNINAAFSKMINLLNGKVKIKDVDFKKFGYQGAVRSLEITYRKKEERIKRFHPHLHVAIVLKNYVPPKAYIQNKFSLGKENVRLFTQDEILLQKVWFLLVNNLKVTKENLKNYESKKVDKSSIEKTTRKKNPGYSCTLDKFRPGQYAEVFKYMIKDKDQEGTIMDYQTFKVLMKSLNNVRQLQGYGCLYNCKEINDTEFLTLADDKIKKILSILDSLEEKKTVEEEIKKIRKEKDFTIISEKKLLNAIKIQSLKERNNIPDDYVYENEELSQDEIKYYINLSKESEVNKKVKEEIREIIINKAYEIGKEKEIIKHIDKYVNIVLKKQENNNESWWKVISSLGFLKEEVKKEVRKNED